MDHTTLGGGLRWSNGFHPRLRILTAVRHLEHHQLFCSICNFGLENLPMRS
jgi:hypothetical protein